MKRNLTRLELKEYKTKLLPFSQEQRDVLIGTLLGDASMQNMPSNQEHNIKWEQKALQKEYIYHIWQLFQDFCGSPPARRIITGGGALCRESYWVRTYRHPYFAEYKAMFYARGTDGKQIKRITPDIGGHLTPRALAYWFMDDGTLAKTNTSHTYVLNTQSFSFEEQIVLQEALDKYFNLKLSVHKDGSKFKLYVKIQSRDNFYDLISPFVLESFQYKLKP